MTNTVQRRSADRQLAEQLPSEMARCRELSQAYASIGPSGVFGKAVIDAALTEAEKAASSHDTVRMLAAYQKLKNCE